MSAGKFEIYNYETDAGTIIKITLQEETTLATFNGSINASPSGSPVAGYPSALVSKSRRSIGIHPRIVTVGKMTGMPSGYLANQTYRVPCLSETVFNGLTGGQAAGYLGGVGKIISVDKEKIR